ALPIWFMSPDLFEQILNYLIRLEILDRNNNCQVALFNWGEPFLNPNINEILEITKKKRFYAQISSNFIVKPDISKELLPTISDITFSLSGFSQQSYGRIHGASLNKTLENFDAFYNNVRRYSPRTHIRISWHRYQFNEHELWDAYRFFNRPCIRFYPSVAFFIDFLEMIAFLKRELPEDRIRQAEKELFLDHIRKGISRSKKDSRNYHCSASNFLVIDEIGQLLLCCGVTSYDSDCVLGNILEMPAKEIWEKKSTNPLCDECLPIGLALWIYNQNPYNDKPWPPGGGWDAPKAWFLYNLRPSIGRIIRKFPNGDRLLNMVKRIPWV
ncbi:MAG: hypothetical protein QG641_906, partial [Candidatus Poribacteria bacterium]|nr:hypothetical protein [Candidatus Poribacteria bacterium]